MERRVEELLVTLHSQAFTDSDSIMNEIRQIVLSPNTPGPSIAFFSSKLLNSEVSLLQFILKNRTESDRLLWKTMSNALTLVSDYIQERGNRIAEYAIEIKETCLQLMASSTKSSMVKEAALRPLIRLLEVFSAKKLQEILNPVELFRVLLDNKLRYEEKTMGSNLKGAIFNMLGLLISNYEEELEDRLKEVQKIMLIRLKDELYKGNKTEEQTIAGILKGYAHALKCFKYEEAEIKEIFTYVKALLTPIQTGRYTVLKASLKVLCENASLFNELIHRHSQEVLRELFNLVKSNNSSVKYLAQETTENVLRVLAEVVIEKQDQICFDYTLRMLNSQINSKSSEVIQNTIKHIGVFSNAIATLKSEEYLKTLLLTIINISQEAINLENEPEDYKGMILSQKRVISLLTAYSDIARSLKSVPESALLHFSEVSVEIFNKNYMWIKKYRSRLYNSLAQLFASLYTHSESFTQWVRIFIVKSMKQLLVLEESNNRIELAGKLWLGVLEQECLTENVLNILSDEIFRFFYQLLLTLDLNYAVNEGSVMPSNPEDQQVLFQASEFSNILWIQISKRMNSWIMPFITLLSRKINELPLLPSLYNMLKVTLKVCDLNSYCDQDLLCKQHVAGLVKSIILSMQNFQDALLSSCIELCLSVPICVVYSPGCNNIKMFQPVLMQALSLSLSYLPLAHTVINTLNSWRKGIPMTALEIILPNLLPALSPFLTVDKISQEIAGQDEANKNRQKKRTVAFRIFKFIGSLGGKSHFMVNSRNENSLLGLHSNLQIRVRLTNRLLEVNFDQILLRVLHLAEKSNQVKTKIAACELLHAIVLFMIGKRTQSDLQFDKVFHYVFPAIYRLAIDLEPLARQLFEPLTKQLVRWFAKKMSIDNPESQTLLEALQESVCSANSALRNLSADCIGEFCKYSVSFNLDPVPNFKVIIKRIQSFGTHPQSEKRRAAVLCLNKMLLPLSQSEALISRFILEFAHELFMVTKLSHYDKNDEILTLCHETLTSLKELVKGKVELLIGSNEERSFHKNLSEFIDWIWEFCKRPERVIREFAQEYWKELTVLSKYDLKKLKTRKNFEQEIGEEAKDCAGLEGLIDFYLWVSECGLVSWNGDELSERIEEFIKSDKGSANPNDTIRAFLVVLKHNQYFQLKCITEELLLQILICPQNLGLYSSAETRELVGLYEEISKKSLEMLRNFGIHASVIFELWNSIEFDSERSMKLSLQGLQALILSQNSVKCELAPISQKLEQKMIDFFKKNSNSEIRKGKLILEFLINTEMSRKCLRELIMDSQIMTSSSELVFEYILKRVETELEVIFLVLSDKPDQLLNFLVPILEKAKSLIEQKKIKLRVFIKSFIKLTVPLFSTLILVPSTEYGIGVIRAYCILLEFSKDLSVFNEGIEEIVSNGLYSHISQILHKFLQESQHFSLKKETLRLLASAWEVFGDKLVHELKPELQEIQSSYFIQSSQNQSSKSSESDSMVKSFLELFLRIKTFESLELLYCFIREQNSSFESELKYVVNEFIKHEVSKDITRTFIELLKVFQNEESDKGMYDNVRWGIALRVIIPLIDYADEILAEELMIICCKDLISSLIDKKFPNILDSKEYFFCLREKTCILLIIEKFLSKIPSNSFKENVHKAIFGINAQGNELTKQIISFCDKYRKEKPERLELIENIQNSADYARRFLQANYACLLTCIRKTQSQERIYFNFLFKDQNWKNLIEDKEDFGFKPQTPFYHKEKQPASSGSEKISNFYICASLFSQEIAILKPEKSKLIETEDFIDIELEPDDINSIIIMKPFLEVIEKMEKSFAQSTEMPQWMQCLHSALTDPSNFTSIKLFIIKIILNRPQSFEKWANSWVPPICSVMSSKNGGKGFHYFLRDTCTLLLYDWKEIEVKSSEKECGKFLNYLVKVSADTNAKIFDSNIKLISETITKFNLPVEHSYLEGMMKKPVNEEDNKAAVAWKLSGILLYGTCVESKVKVLQDGKENLEALDECLIKCLDVNRRSITNVAAQVVGKRLNFSPGLTESLLDLLKKKEVKDISSYVSIIEKVTNFYAQILDQKQISSKINSLLTSLSGNVRASLLTAVLNYSNYLNEKGLINNLPDICEYINREKERIANDNEDSHRLALLKLLSSLLNHTENFSIKKTVSSVLLLLSPFASASSPEIRKNLYEVMQKAYDRSQHLENPVEIRSKSREILLKGLTDSTHSDFILAFWNSQDRLSQDPQTRIYQCLSEFYTPECEELWLVVSSHLLIGLSKLSDDYEKVLFDQPLDSCEFKQMTFSKYEKSLPMTPMFSPSYFQQEIITKKSSFSSSQFLPPKTQRIRHFTEYSQAGLEQRREKVHKIQMDKMEQRIAEQKARQANILRTYRTGELPDIQIKLADIMGPLSNLILLDCEIASEVWVSLCPLLFVQLDQNSRKRIIEAINRIFEVSQLCNPAVISSMHRTIRALVCINSDFAKEINPKHIYSSGVKSMCFQSAIMLLQECLLKFDSNSQFNPHSGSEIQKVTKHNKELWIYLTKVYEKMGDHDSVKGLWLKIFEETSPGIVSDVQLALNFKSSGDLESANSVYKKIIPQVSRELKGMIQSEYDESLSHLAKWQVLSETIEKDYSENNVQNTNLNSIKIKALLRQNKFAELTEIVQAFPSAVLYTRFPYEMSLLNITQDDTDRSRYYMDQEFSRFVEKWQALNPLSYLAKHKLIQKIQKVFDLAEFLSIKEQKKNESYEEYIERVVEIVNNWSRRLPSMALDEFGTWEEILFGRVLFFDKLKTNIDFEPFGLTDFSSLLYAKFSEFPLKLGWFQVSEMMLKESLNKRQDHSKVDFNILAPVLKLRAKVISSNNGESETKKVVNYFNSLIDRLKGNSDLSDNRSCLLYGQLNRYLTKAMFARKDAENTLKSATKEAYSSFVNVKDAFPLKFARFCDSLLRKFEENPKKFSNLLTEVKISPEVLAQNIISSALSSMKLGNQRANDMFPRLISLLKYQGCSRTLETELQTLPEWMLIRWIGQILAIFDKPECDAFSEVISRLIFSFPQVFFYYYKAFVSIDSYSTYVKVFKGPKSKTWKMTEEILSKFGYLQDFTDALDQLTYPEHRLRSYLDLLSEAVTSSASPDYFNYLSIEITQSLLKPKSAGVYNKKFASDWERLFQSLLSGPLSLLSSKNPSEVVQFVEKCKGKLADTPFDKATCLISMFSEWLADYTLDPYTEETIDVPGMTSGFQQPTKEKQIRIVAFDQSVLILRSIRKPKRIGLHGSDEKLYFMMVKGGEDLRLDQRIQQVFTVMNRIFIASPDCAKNELGLKTFEIIPITKRLGLIEWVDNTEPLRSIIDNELDKHYKIKGISQTHANQLRRTWLRSLAAATDDNYVQHHLIALGKDRESVVTNFKAHESSLPWDLVRQSLLSMGTIPESYLFLRKKFINSLAVLSVAGYIIGLGDRHLDNILLDRSDGGLLLIDFGVSFGQGVFIGIPELMPFRMTRQFISVLSPEGLKGELRYSMIHCLKALRKNQNSLLDCCEVFINEPLQDWLKGGFSDKNLPKKKLDILKRKLNGGNSAGIMLEEIEDSRHAGAGYFESIVDAIYGNIGSMRRDLGDDLSVDQQVDMLIEHATDPNILGRTWIGWSPIV